MNRPDNPREPTTELEGMLKGGVSLEDLRGGDGVLAPALQSLLADRAAGRRLSEEERKRWELVARRAGSVTFRVASRRVLPSHRRCRRVPTI